MSIYEYVYIYLYMTKLGSDIIRSYTPTVIVARCKSLDALSPTRGACPFVRTLSENVRTPRTHVSYIHALRACSNTAPCYPSRIRAALWARIPFVPPLGSRSR